jgi:hypothetical protein
MALAVRTGIIHAPFELLAEQSSDLVATALAAMANAQPRGPAAGHA